MSRPRLGFVGLGWIGAMRLEAVAGTGRAEIAALCDATPGRLEATAREYPQAACFAAGDDLIARAQDLRLDGLVVATPNALHALQTLEALDAGLAVFCQKPLALNAREAREMVAAARQTDRLLGVDYSYRFTEGARRLRASLEAGELGRVFSLDTVFHNAYGPDKPWCFDRRLSGGGALMDLGVHLIDLAFWLLDDPAVREVQGKVFRDGVPLREGDVDDYASVRIELAGGAVLTLAVSWNAHAGADCVIKATLLGTRGGAEFRNVDGSFYDFELARFAGRSTEIEVKESRDWLGKAIVDWVDRLASANRFDPQIERSVRVSEVVDAVYERA
ncbi:MAG TPA: Gfo/Idh/MocA family oxidoreductase [Thermoanaerobaculia bacterium]|nr:Gfo/Idh/MocA family oxidoreductase [Thermoanaerobaculia bacterium]